MSDQKFFPASIKTIAFRQLSGKIKIVLNPDIKNIEVNVLQNKSGRDLLFQYDDHKLLISGQKSEGIFNHYNSRQIIIWTTDNHANRVELFIQVPLHSAHVIENSGAVDLVVEEMEKIHLKNSGQGDIHLNNIKEIELSISGQGDVKIENTLSLKGRISGQGDIEIISQECIDTVDLSISGMGDIVILSDVRMLNLSHSGMGDILVKGNIGFENVSQTGMGVVRFK